MVAILMATYNGGYFIKEQIDSILCQIYTDWKLFIKDDGSSDNTLNIIEEYALKYPQKITLFRSKEHLGAAKNFMFLLEHVSADYYMFSDQDDIWMSDKVSESVKYIENIECICKKRPILIHSDLEVVDVDKNTIYPSFYKANGLYSILQNPDYLKCVNYTTGCTFIFNNETRNICVPMPSYSIMHDYWIAMCVYKNDGIISFVDSPTIKYRQHGNNVVGYKGSLSFIDRLFNIKETIKNHVEYYKMSNKYLGVKLYMYIICLVKLKIKLGHI